MASVAELLAAIGGRGVTSASELATALKVSQPSISRLLGEAGARVCRLGRTRGVRYALVREVAGLGRTAPLYQVDDNGKPHMEGTVHFLAGDRYWLEQPGGGKLFEGLPPFIGEMCPQGYIGRGFAERHPDLGLPWRIRDWREDHHLLALARRGEDCVGNRILGEESLDRFLQQPPTIVDRADYPALASGALAAQVGSSAGGEHPKFAVCTGGRHVLVKFAGGDGAAAQRWRDLLLAEHLALEAVRAAGIAAAASTWFDLGGMRFLESERFDRVGARGRRAVLSLGAINNGYLGFAHESWSRAAQRLPDEPALSVQAADLRRLIWLDTFGELCGNTDRHYYNITFFVEQARRLLLALAPAYDMLPMCLAPQGTQLVETTFAPRGPSAANFDLWPEAAAAGLAYWDRLVQTEELSEGFRQQCARCRAVVAGLGR